MIFQDLIKSDILFDSHCHLVAPRLKDNIPDHLLRAKEAGVEYVVSVAVDMETSKSVGEQKSRYEGMQEGAENRGVRAGVLATAGLDPELLVPGSDLYLGRMSEAEFPAWLETSLKSLILHLESGGYAAIGECGLDSHWLYRAVRDNKLSREEMDESLARQEQLFRMQLELAQECRLPLTVHSRNIEKRCLQIVNEYDVTAVFHSFTGGYKVATKILDTGHYLGMNGIVTYDSARDLREVYRRIYGKPPVDATPSWFYRKQILFETDAPWLKPFDAKGLNGPAGVREVFEFARGGMGLIGK